jgi:cell pole-organizing protein PopZ
MRQMTMAMASSAQREPSMEEILASIRRIIEDSDGGRKQPIDDAESASLEETAAEIESARAGSAEVEVFRTELRHGEPQSEPRKPVSLAEVQARVASEQALPIEPAAKAAAVDAGQAEETAQPVDNADGAGPGFTGVAPAEASYAFDDAEAADPQIDIDDSELTLDDEPGTGAGAETPSFRPALVSEQTSRQVAAAFGELSEAFASRSKKSFDEMAEEMLKPMLQDWLDNNLPTLVERLVREEIERVARGGA